MVQAVYLCVQRGSAFGVVKSVKHLHCVSKDEPRALSSRYIFSIYLQITTRGSTTSGCFRAYWLSSALIVRSDKKLLSLTEDTVDLGSADWADALCHTAT